MTAGNRLGLLVAAVLVVAGLAVAVSNAVAERPPDLPEQMEIVIATETDCDDLTEILADVPGWNQPSDVKSYARTAILDRRAELGCVGG